MDPEKFLENAQIVVMAGGIGTRLSHRTSNKSKHLLKVLDKTLLEHCLDRVKDRGCSRFVFLLGSGGAEIEKFVKEKKLVCNPIFVMEKKPLGKGGALKNAITSGAIDSAQPCITVQPDDIILDSNFLEKFVAAHLRGKELECKGTVLCVEKTKYPYGVVEIDGRGVVARYEEKPFVNYITNTGMWVLEPEVYDYIKKLVDLDRAPVEFEYAVAPELAKRGLLFSHIIEYDKWIPVNDEKEYQRACEILGNHS